MTESLTQEETFISKRGVVFQLQWTNPEKLKAKDRKIIEQLFVGSFFPCYRPALDHLSDDQLRAQLAHYFTESILPHLHATERYLLLVKAEQRIAAFAFFEQRSGSEIYIAELAIDPDYWKQGLGKQIMNSILTKAPETKRIVLITQRINQMAQEFYKRLGFVPSGYMHPGYSSEKYCAYEINVKPKMQF